MFNPPKTNLWYCNKYNYRIGDKTYKMYMAEGDRGFGRTSYWLTAAHDHFIETGKKFLYLRRSEVEMQLALNLGIFNGCINAYPDYWKKFKGPEKNKRSILRYGEDEIGYYATLNNVKGLSVEDCDLCIFDEYIAPKRSAYKGGNFGSNEPLILFKLLETIFRKRDFTVIFLGNHDSPSNPYSEVFHIPFNSEIYKDKSRGLFYEYTSSPEARENKRNTTIGLITNGTAYGNYSMGNDSLEEISKDLICERPVHTIQDSNIKILGNVVTVWFDESTNVLYLTDSCKLNKDLAIISVTNADMSINTEFIKNNNRYLEFLRVYYGSGKMRFNSQKTASLFLTMCNLFN